MNPALLYPQLRQRAGDLGLQPEPTCTGWKLGYAIAPPALSAEGSAKCISTSVFCSFNPAQHAFAEMIEAGPEHYETLGAFYRAARPLPCALGDKIRAAAGPGRVFQVGGLFGGGITADLICAG